MLGATGRVKTDWREKLGLKKGQKEEVVRRTYVRISKTCFCLSSLCRKSMLSNLEIAAGCSTSPASLYILAKCWVNTGCVQRLKLLYICLPAVPSSSQSEQTTPVDTLVRYSHCVADFSSRCVFSKTLLALFPPPLLSFSAVHFYLLLGLGGWVTFHTWTTKAPLLNLVWSLTSSTKTLPTG